MTFDQFDLHEQILEAISYMNYKEPTPIQVLAIPEIIKGRDLVACAQTGTGKTAAFVLPVLDKLAQDPVHETNVLIIVPTRELAVQIDQQIQGFSYFLGGIESIAIYGGGDAGSWEQQRRALTSGANIIVATPGKLISHLNMGYVKFDSIKYLILDEADRMLDMGFHEDLMKIIGYLPEKRQTLMFSATMPPEIRKLAETILTDQAEVTLALSKPAEGVLQAAYLCYSGQKNDLVNRLIADKPKYESILLFTSTKSKVFEIVRALKGKGFPVEGISSDLEQREREEVLMRFKARKTRVLVATDVLSRGIDIKDINLVINYDVPQDAEDYVHRVGRTARASTTGVAITLITPDDMGRFHRIEKLIEREIPKQPVPEDLGPTPQWNPRSPRDRSTKRPAGARPQGRRKPGRR